MTHIAFERLSELAESDAAGAGAARDDEPRHLAACTECRDTVSELRALLSAARSLPREVAPPAQVWTQLRSRVGARVPARTGRSRSWVGVVAAAAGVVFIVGAALLIAGGRGRGKGMTPTVSAPTAPAAARLERHYAATLAELRATLDVQRPKYTPAAARVVDRSLAVIDTAIAEARSALASDPQNSVLVDILSSHYERKVELLQRASELAPSS